MLIRKKAVKFVCVICGQKGESDAMNTPTTCGDECRRILRNRANKLCRKKSGAITIGDYWISRSSEEKIFIKAEKGGVLESGSFSIDAFEVVVEKFFNDNF
jgi:predicted nucleic acid-binding Zn ribbon protein